MELVLENSVPLLLLTDTKSLCDVLMSNKSTMEGILMLDWIYSPHAKGIAEGKLITLV